MATRWICTEKSIQPHSTSSSTIQTSLIYPPQWICLYVLRLGRELTLSMHLSAAVAGAAAADD